MREPASYAGAALTTKAECSRFVLRSHRFAEEKRKLLWLAHSKDAWHHLVAAMVTINMAHTITASVQDRRRSLAICAVALLGLGFLFLVNPAASGWLPPCPFHALTGLDCPGCGSLRALHSLLHLDVMQALGCNPMTCMCLPFLGCWWLWHAGRAITGRAVPVPFIRPALLWVMVAMIFAFGIARNLLR